MRRFIPWLAVLLPLPAAAASVTATGKGTSKLYVMANSAPGATIHVIDLTTLQVVTWSRYRCLRSICAKVKS